MSSALLVGELYAILSLSKSAFEKDLAASEKSAKGWASTSGAHFSSFAKVATAALAAVGVALLGIAKIALDSAKEQEKADRLVVASFGHMSDAVNAWAQKSAFAFGVNDDVLEASVAKYGIWAKNVGQTTEAAAGNAEALSKRAAEIAAATDGSYEEIFEALLKGVQGATKGLKGYGVAIDNSLIQQTALTMGIWDGKGKIDLYAASMARQAIILQQTTGYVSAAADAHESLAFKEKQFGVVMDQVWDSVGAAIMPIALLIMSTLLPAFQAIATWITENMPAIQAVFEAVFSAIATVIGTAVDALQPFFQAVSSIISAFVSFMQEGNNFRDFLIAIGIIITAAVLPPMLAWAAATIAATWPLLVLIAAVFLIVKALDDLGVLGPIVENVMKAVAVAFDIVKNSIAGWEIIIKAVMKALGYLGDEVGELVDLVTGAWDNLLRGTEAAWNGVVAVIKGVVNFIIGIINAMIDGINSLQIHIPPIGIEGIFQTPAFDWSGFGIPRIPYMHRGGIVPGSFGADVPIIAQAGERVIPAGQAGRPGGASVSLVVNNPAPEPASTSISRELQKLAAMGFLEPS